eukprot:4731546-Karenia_brevis.AAC.1
MSYVGSQMRKYKLISRHQLRENLENGLVTLEHRSRTHSRDYMGDNHKGSDVNMPPFYKQRDTSSISCLLYTSDAADDM